jgi:hypothetical protein
MPIGEKNRASAAADATATVLDEALDAAAAAPMRVRCAVAECIDDTHPTLLGRVLVRWRAGASAREAWVPTLHGAVVRRGDRVLLQQPDDWPEPIATGVVDGYARRDTPPTRSAATVELRDDEAVVVTDATGVPLVEVSRGERGPLVRLASADVDLEIPGRLRVRAKELALEATEGNATIDAQGDVIVRGEVIELN